MGQRTGKHLAWHAGDISPTAPGAERLSEFFYIECKCVKSLDLNSWIFRGTGRGLQFWKDACVKANIYNKYPMLIAKENVTRTLLIVPSNLPNIEVAPAALARLPDATFYDYETVLSQAFWLAPTTLRAATLPPLGTFVSTKISLRHHRRESAIVGFA